MRLIGCLMGLTHLFSLGCAVKADAFSAENTSDDIADTDEQATHAAELGTAFETDTGTDGDMDTDTDTDEDTDTDADTDVDTGTDVDTDGDTDTDPVAVMNDDTQTNMGSDFEYIETDADSDSAGVDGGAAAAADAGGTGGNDTSDGDTEQTDSLWDAEETDISDVDAGISAPGVGSILITEIAFQVPDSIELLNLTDGPIELAGWRLDWWGVDSDDDDVSNSEVFPSYVLAPKSRLIVEDDYELQGERVMDEKIVFSRNIEWSENDHGAVALVNADGEPVDYVQWGASTNNPPEPLTWTIDPVNLLPTPEGIGLSRRSDEDNDKSGDFCPAPMTLGEPNEPCR